MTERLVKKGELTTTVGLCQRHIIVGIVKAHFCRGREYEFLVRFESGLVGVTEKVQEASGKRVQGDTRARLSGTEGRKR